MNLITNMHGTQNIKMRAYLFVRGLFGRDGLPHILPIPTTLLHLLKILQFSFLLSQGTTPTCNNIDEVNFLVLKPTRSYLYFSKGALGESTDRLV
jgi:hypothetical protein